MANDDKGTDKISVPLGPLAGVRVLDVGMLVGGPFAASLLGDFGAEVIKVEQPRAGDPLRLLHPHKNGVPLWWKVTSRNKKAITLDLHDNEGQRLFRRLAAKCDVVVESFRPGTLENWDLGYDRLHKENRQLIMLRVSGFGQTGPYRLRSGFGRIGEAMSGVAHITGDPDGPPLHAGFPLADYTSGLFGAYAVLMSLYARANSPDYDGEVIDIGLYESAMRLLEFFVIEFDQLGRVPTRQGNRNSYVAPVNTYQTADGKWLSFTASTQSTVLRLFEAIGRSELIEDPRFATNDARLAHVDELDAILAAWMTRHTAAEIDKRFDGTGVPYAWVYDAEDLVNDPHVRERGNVVTVSDDELGAMRMQGVVPRLARHPGTVRWPGPRLGQHNEEIYCGLLGLAPSELTDLEARGVV